MVFKKLKARDPAGAANVGDLAAEHRSGAERLRRVAQAVESVLMDREGWRSRVCWNWLDVVSGELMLSDQEATSTGLSESFDASVFQPSTLRMTI
jgi:hypothetical protein